MSYLKDYIHYNSGNECPDSFWHWSALTLLGHIAGRKIAYHHGGEWLPIFPSLYTGLIGDAGSGKSTAKSEVKRIIVEHFPTYAYSASIQSREDIVLKMAAPECVRYQKERIIDGIMEIPEWRPFFVIANEFENFLSVNPVNMVSFLVDIFDENWFSTGFKKDAKQQNFKNPHLSILACGTPQWLMREMKISLFSGGLGRRLILVCDKSDKICPDPYRPHDYKEVKARVIDHLKWVESLEGVFTRSEDGKKWWHEWYPKHKKEKVDDPILAQFKSTKHIMLIKVAMGVALTERDDRLILTGDHFAMALHLFDALVPRIQELTAGAGANENAGYAAQIMETLRMNDGAMPEKRLYAVVYRHSPQGERAYTEALNFLEKTGEIVRVTPRTGLDEMPRMYIATAEWYAEYEKQRANQSE